MKERVGPYCRRWAIGECCLHKELWVERREFLVWGEMCRKEKAPGMRRDG
jgi:hypothetical protein